MKSFTISIYVEHGKTILATLKPTMLLELFHTPQLAAVAQEVEDSMVKIMRQAVAGDPQSLPPAH